MANEKEYPSDAHRIHDVLWLFYGFLQNDIDLSRPLSKREINTILNIVKKTGEVAERLEKKIDLLLDIPEARDFLHPDAPIALPPDLNESEKKNH